VHRVSTGAARPTCPRIRRSAHRNAAATRGGVRTGRDRRWERSRSSADLGHESLASTNGGRDKAAIDQLLAELAELRELDRRRQAHAPGSTAYDAATLDLDLRSNRLMDRFRDLTSRVTRRAQSEGAGAKRLRSEEAGEKGRRNRSLPHGNGSAPHRNGSSPGGHRTSPRRGDMPA
jgi:hypothetical protein